MGSNLEKISDLCIELQENILQLDEELGKLKDVSDENQFEIIFSQIDIKEKLLKELRELLETEELIPEKINLLKTETFTKILEVTKKEIEFYKENKKRIKEIMLQINQKNKINSGYIEKITNSYFIDRKIT